MNWQDIVQKYDLDVSVVNFDELIGRIDAEYYQKDYLDKLSILSRKRLVALKDIGFITDGEHGSPDWDQSSGIKYITAENIKANYIEDNNFSNISRKQFERNKRASLTERDVLIYSVGMNAGLVAKMEAHLLPASIPRSVAIVRPNNLSSEYLSVFLNSKFGKFQSERLQAGNAQPVLALNNIQRFQIVVPNDLFQMKISELYNFAYKSRLYSRELYSQAEKLLLTELGLVDYVSNEANTSIRDLFECLQDDRFDAEYWMPKYDEIIEKIKSYKNGFRTIGKDFTQLKNNFKRQDDKDYNYIEIGDVNVSTGEVNYCTMPGKELPANAKVKFVKRQLITSKVRPNRGATAILSNHEGFIGSGAFTVLTEKGNVNLETLMVYLKTQSIRELLLRYNTGTSYPVIIDNDILQLPIPIVEQSIQDKIGEYIITASKAREQSKHLLEKAKRAVEIFIEQNEAQALTYLAS